MSDAINKPVPLAVIIGAHGVAGEVRLKLYCESLDSLKQHHSFSNNGLTLKSVKAHKMGAIARFAEINDRNAAEAARGMELTVPRSALPELGEDEFYHIDIVGLRCISDAGEELGVIFAIHDFGAGDVIEIEKPTAKKFMVPAHAIDLTGDPAIVETDFIEP